MQQIDQKEFHNVEIEYLSENVKNLSKEKFSKQKPLFYHFFFNFPTA